MKTISPLVLLLCLLLPATAQKEDQISGPHEFTGSFTDVSGHTMSGIYLYFRKGESTLTFRTDLDGKFKVGLQPGEYEIQVNKSNSRTFHGFISITAAGPNPSDVTFVLDPDDACCRFQDGSQYPKPLVLPWPPYPPAARAVRAAGEVEVELVVEPDGTVSTATARNGHPLLRAASVQAARGAKFEPLSSQEKRNLVLTFVFIDFDTDKAPARYKNLYRIEVVSAVEI